jgi:hypothetical protein
MFPSKRLKEEQASRRSQALLEPGNCSNLMVTSVHRHSQKSKFRDIDSCALCHAQERRLDATAEDFRYRCGHSCCGACGIYAMQRWAAHHERKAIAIRDRGTHWVLGWSDLPIDATSQQSFMNFLDAVRELRDELSHGRFARSPGFMLHTEINLIVRERKVYFHPHIHFFLVGQFRMLFGIGSWWRSRGGINAKPYLGRDFEVFRRYSVANKKIEERRAYPRRWRYLHHRVIGPLECSTNRCAVIRAMGGPTLSAQGFRKLMARARVRDLGEQISASDPDRKYQRYCPDLRNVCFCSKCPVCNKWGPESVIRNGYTSSGTLRWRCKYCGKSWTDRPQFRRKTPGRWRMSV